MSFIIYLHLVLCNVQMFLSTLWRTEASKVAFAKMPKES